MVLAAGLGTRLRPLTYELPKPMVPVLDRPVMAHILDLLQRHGCERVIANLHHFPDTIRDYFGDEIEYRFEQELLGTAGGVRNCRDFLCAEDEPFLIISGDALTDLDLDSFLARHREAGGIATLAVKRVSDTRQYGVVVHDDEGRISGFQEKPEPADARSDLGNCGIYMLEPAIFDHFPERPFADWAQDVFPALLERDVPFHVHDIGEQYWNDVGSLEELRAGTFDALSGALRLEIEGEVTLDEGGQPVWIGRDVSLGEDVRLTGPLVIGDEARIGDRAALRGTIVFPGTAVAEESILIGAIAGRAGIVASLRPRVTRRRGERVRPAG